MAEVISTVGTGKTYTSLQLWDDDKDGDANSEQTAECYGPDDLGTVVLGGWTGTGGTPKIVSAAGNKPDGTTSVNGCANVAGYIQNINTQGLHVDGMFIDSNTYVQGYLVTTGDCVLENSVVFATYSNIAVAAVAYYGVNISASFICRNNAIYLNNIRPGINARMLATSGTRTLTATVENNSVYDAVNDSGAIAGLSFREWAFGAGVSVVSGTCENNVVTSSSGVCFVHYLIVNGTIATNNCASTDGTADDFGGSGNLVDQVAADMFTSTTNLMPKNTSNLRNAGKTLAAVPTDIKGVSRPSGSAYDIGAFEVLEIDVVLSQAPNVPTVPFNKHRTLYKRRRSVWTSYKP